jgi:hypothetical protein
MREYRVRICERLGVKFPGSTRQQRAWIAATGMLNFYFLRAPIST